MISLRKDRKSFEAKKALEDGTSDYRLSNAPNKPPILPKPVISKPPIPPKPVLDTFSRPLTKMIDSKKNKIQIIPKKIESNDIEDVNLSKQL